VGENTILYFAYGSNMSTEQLRIRAESAMPVGMARAPGKRVVFNKLSRRDGSAKANLEEVEGEGQAWGVLFRVRRDDLRALDRFEDGYKKRTIEVVKEDGERVSAMTYVSKKFAKDPRPFRWYLQSVINGALEHALPPEYVEYLASTRVRENVRAP